MGVGAGVGVGGVTQVSRRCTPSTDWFVPAYVISRASRLGSDAKYGSSAKGSDNGDDDSPELVAMDDDDDDDVATDAPMDVSMLDDPDPDEPEQGMSPHAMITELRMPAHSGSARH